MSLCGVRTQVTTSLSFCCRQTGRQSLCGTSLSVHLLSSLCCAKCFPGQAPPTSQRVPFLVIPMWVISWHSPSLKIGERFWHHFSVSGDVIRPDICRKYLKYWERLTEDPEKKDWLSKQMRTRECSSYAKLRLFSIFSVCLSSNQDLAALNEKATPLPTEDPSNYPSMQSCEAESRCCMMLFFEIDPYLQEGWKRVVLFSPRLRFGLGRPPFDIFQFIEGYRGWKSRSHLVSWHVRTHEILVNEDVYDETMMILINKRMIPQYAMIWYDMICFCLWCATFSISLFGLLSFWGWAEPLAFIAQLILRARRQTGWHTRLRSWNVHSPKVWSL